VALMASDAGNWIAGQVIRVNGGYSLLEETPRTAYSQLLGAK
jgi:hypothetical protein